MAAQFSPNNSAMGPSSGGYINRGWSYQDEIQYDFNHGETDLFASQTLQNTFATQPPMQQAVPQHDLYYSETEPFGSQTLQNTSVTKPPVQQVTRRRTWSNTLPILNSTAFPTNQHPYHSSLPTIDGSRACDIGSDMLTNLTAGMQLNLLHNNPVVFTQGYEIFQGQGGMSVPSQQAAHPGHIIDHGYSPFPTNISTLDNRQQFAISPLPSQTSMSLQSDLQFGRQCGYPGCNYQADAGIGPDREKRLEQNLRKHRQRQHSGKMFECDFCNHTSKRWDNLATHMESQHTESQHMESQHMESQHMVRRAASNPVQPQAPPIHPPARCQTQ